MESLFWYMLSANVIFILGYAAFYLFYRNDTHFKINRYLLLWILFAGCLIPLLPAFNWWPEPVLESFRPTANDEETYGFEISATSETGEIAEVIPQIVQSLEQTQRKINLFFLLLYVAFATILFVRLLIQLLSLLRVIWPMQKTKMEDYIFLRSDQTIAPFSFLNMVVMNPDLYEKERAAYILQHELVHVRQKHHLDILFSELLCILCWFNPVVWRLRKSVRQNLEFLADAEVLDSGINRKQYQYSLLSLNLPGCYQSTLVNHFNQSLLKKRIIMMNLKKSSDFFSKKHLLLIPVLLLMVFANMPMQAQEPDSFSTEDQGINATTNSDEDDSFNNAPTLEGEQTIGVIRGALNMETLQVMQREFKRRGVELNYSNIDFTEDGKLSRIRIEVIGWDKNPKSLQLDNNGAMITEVMTAYIFHNAESKSVRIGLQKGLPQGLPEARLKLLKKFAGIAVISDQGDVYAKGQLRLGEGIDAQFGDIEHSEKRSKSQN